LLNVNVPDVPHDQLKGVEVTRLGRRHKAQPVVKGTNPRGETVYWVGPAGAAREAGPGTDFFADGGGTKSLRLAFSFVSPEEIADGVEKLAGLLRGAPSPASAL